VGVTAIVTIVALLTVRVPEALAEARLAVTVTDPVANPFDNPLPLPTVATVLSEEVQLT
jgi:hypothetical protein